MRTARTSEAGALLDRAECSVAGLVDRQAGRAHRRDGSGLALAVALSRLPDDEAANRAARESLALAEELARTLPCPAGLRHAAAARRLMDGATGPGGG
ncbi:hypothetical protein ABZ362_00030 [Streptomyces sp. NPDC005951]|uniref:hypothetical protein n=1 Tax=Streptomyces sp. NPDC005951 TaxID=3154573 RepID=UPI0033CC6DA1